MPSHSKVVAAVVEFAEELFPGFVFDIFPTPCGFGVLPILVESGQKYITPPTISFVWILFGLLHREPK